MTESSRQQDTAHDPMCPAIQPYAETLCECALIAKVKADIWADTVEHTISRSIAYDAWWAERERIADAYGRGRDDEAAGLPLDPYGET